jgi:thiol-disulfide isomerase/thioredoxin
MQLRKIVCISLVLVAIAVSAAAPTVKKISPAGVKKQVASYKGKVVFLNYYATWCPPCVREFPDIVKLSNKYRKSGLVVIAVSMDDPNQTNKVISFLKAQKATFPAFIKNTDDPQVFIKGFDKKWDGAIPRTYIYNKKGKLYKAVTGSQSYAEWEALVKPLLK